MQQTTLLAALALLSGADAFWRMPCLSRTGLARIDPLMDRGLISDHAHAVHGGSNFGFNTQYEDLLNSNCTSCSVTQDKSAYWTPPLNFIYSNGTSVLVPQVGGMLAYYLLFGENITAFPENFRMLAGDTRRRNFTLTQPDPPKSEWPGTPDGTESALRQKALGFNCLNYAKAPEPSLYRHQLPNKTYIDDNCPQGLRLELMFPSCWNGRDPYAEDHKSHMRYSTLVMDGDCPSGFETRVPSLFYETIWNTSVFKGEDGQFVLGNGDPTGCGYHGDFMTGWKVDFLQNAVETCKNPSGEISDCPVFDNHILENHIDGVSNGRCNFEMPEKLEDDHCKGPRDGLCGGVPIQSGPTYATKLTPGLSIQPTATGQPQTTSNTYGGGKSSSNQNLGYSKGTSLLTDNSGSTISGVVAEAFAHAVKTPSPSSEKMVAVSAASSPTPTPIPETTSSEEGDPKAVSTSTYVSGGAEYEIYIEEEYVTTTVTVDSPSKKRRHFHHHRRGHHGGLGGTF